MKKQGLEWFVLICLMLVITSIMGYYSNSQIIELSNKRMSSAENVHKIVLLKSKVLQSDLEFYQYILTNRDFFLQSSLECDKKVTTLLTQLNSSNLDNTQKLRIESLKPLIERKRNYSTEVVKARKVNAHQAILAMDRYDIVSTGRQISITLSTMEDTEVKSYKAIGGDFTSIENNYYAMIGIIFVYACFSTFMPKKKR